jgi:hypothetical protein
MNRLLDDLKAVGVDVLGFGAMNLVQARRPGGDPDLGATRRYLRHWDGATLAQRLRPPDGAGFDLCAGRFEAPSPLPFGLAANDRVRLDIRLGPDGWRSPTMFLLHALMSVSDRGYRRWSQRLNERGWSAIFVHLPYHYDRCPPGVPSGAMAVTANLVRTVEGLRQATVELRLAMAALRARGCRRIGVWGQSYGALIGGLLAAVEPELHTAWLLEPILDLSHALWVSPATLAVRRQLRAAGITPELTSRGLQEICPSRRAPAMAPERILLLAGRFDRIAPAAVVRQVRDRWRGSHYADFCQGHIGYTLMPRAWELGQALGLL